VAPSPTSSTASDASDEAPAGDLEGDEGSVNGDDGPVSAVPARAVNAKDGVSVNRRARRASNLAERRRQAKEDRALVEKAQQGDREAFRQLVQRHQRRAFAVAIGVVRDENDAREIVQEAFLRVHKSLDKFEGGSSFFTWLYRIVKNLSIDFMRKPARREAELFDDPKVADDAELFPFVSRIEGADPMDEMRRQEIGARIQDALDALPPYHRSVIIMREVEGMSYQQMAEAMEVSKGTIMSRLYHARQKLQKALADCYREQLGTEPSERGNES
jgi:RNA polymerase sigma-70 factor (ECF subfamily)